MPFVRSNRFSGTSSIEPRLIAEALFTQPDSDMGSP
jgi:hypothetical protein